MINFLSLSSGSSGNCYFFTDGKVSFLIDAGVGPRISAKKLSEYGFSLKQIDFILVTHDHIDHIKALGIIASKYSKPVYTTEKLCDALRQNACTRGRMSVSFHILKAGTRTDVCGVAITPFKVSHDSSDAVGYHFVLSGRSITLITDCGKIEPHILEYASLADTLILESNYDLKMLAEGGYTPLLKQRILGEYGHLSNDDAAQIIKSVYPARQGKLEQIFLCHISDNNNTPQLAYNCANEALKTLKISEKDVYIKTLPRGKASELYSL